MGPPGALAPFEKETWVCLPMLVVTAGDRAVTVRERAGIPNAGNNGRDPIGDRARSLTVTALSCGAYFMISWRMKFQVSPAPGCAGSFQEETLVGDRRSIVPVRFLLGSCVLGADTDSRARLS